jgi:futalosine hydrolase
MIENLILVPTQFELRQMQLASHFDSRRAAVETCGLGVIHAAAQAARWINHWQPRSVLLVGIAGSLDERLQIGEAYEFRQVVCFGIGVGSGWQHQTVEELGWLDWLAPPRIGDKLILDSPVANVTNGSSESGLEQLLTSCAAAENQEDVAVRKAKFPQAVAEDMEGFAVAVACKLAGVPLRIVRGISNRAGQRDKSTWQIPAALQSAERMAHKLLTL